MVRAVKQRGEAWRLRKDLPKPDMFFCAVHSARDGAVRIDHAQPCLKVTGSGQQFGTQFAFVKFCESVVRIGVFRHRDRAREGPICALKPIAAVFLAVHSLFFLAAQHQRPILDADVQIIPLHAWQLDSHAQYLPFVDHADARPRTR